MSKEVIKQDIKQALRNFQHGTLRDSALRLWQVLGYESERTIDAPFSAASFLDQFDAEQRCNRDKLLASDWQQAHLLFQLTGDDIRQAAQLSLFDGTGKVIDNARMESYLVLAVGLTGERYTRTQLAQATREINKLFPMPVLLLFQHSDTLTLSIINRRLHKRDRSKDVLEKVTLIKDIVVADPHRAHIEILFDLSLAELERVHGFTNFVELHRAWQQTLDSSELNKRFFKEIANWYFWALQEVVFPEGAGDDVETRNATSVIRLITRLIFVWFLKEKGLVADDLFRKSKLDSWLTWDDDSTYYKAILQNLFFATLNQEMNNADKPDRRKFRGQGRQHYNITNLYRYERLFRDADAVLERLATIPFLNGGLFECLDKRDKDDSTRVLRVDGFSDRDDNPLRVPDALFLATSTPSTSTTRTAPAASATRCAA
ncbi:MAG: hypothetical protein M9928_21885 [Anaerolineae bacterium]|nr:hypothetical protein [Anaerolineae bacterium]MCO5207666.1 hypothetical protein [Anaerolineae bacterium]